MLKKRSHSISNNSPLLSLNLRLPSDLVYKVKCKAVDEKKSATATVASILNDYFHKPK